jgi:hypothetical protein
MRPGCLRLAAVCLLAAAGCQDEARDPARYVPSEETARQALEQALSAWRECQEPRRVGNTVVQVADAHRRPGQRLRRYVILGEVPGEAPRCFAVRLSLEGPSEEVRARYIVLGIDPLWVFRHEDFEMLSHWECADEKTPTPQPKKAVDTGAKSKP